jgi:hypothetical protein
MPLPFVILQVTAAYSNAVLVAIMPHVSDFAKKLDLPIPQPVSASQVASFRCSPRSDHIGGRITLTNGFQFVFDQGGIRLCESPHCFYALQNPDLIPKFFGTVKISESQAIQIAHKAIQKLGYSDAMLCADRAPQITPPVKDKTNYIPRYRIRWLDPTRGTGGPDHLPPSIEFEINAATGEIEMLNIYNPNTWQPDPKVDVHTPVIGKSPEAVYRGGRKMYPVSQAYSNAFLVAILPQCSAYAKNIGYSFKHSLTLQDVDRSQYSCGLVDSDPMAEVNLKDGTRFNYSHGQVIGFYASDVMELPGKHWPYSPLEYDKFQKKFYGPVNMTTKEAVALVRQSIENLGYSGSVLNIDEAPLAGGPSWWGTNRIARCSMQWQEPNQGAIRVQAEVDLAAKSIKSLYINDHANTNIWRKPPRIDVPIN